ncbi:MAG: hypothetical protein M9938_03260 [Solirubrobacterales bacterium]|nr:hypothetical protein [Solirubrobacterales bacterium]
MRLEKKLTIDQISERLAISRTTVFYWVRKLPIPETERQSKRRLAASRANSERAKRKREEAYRQGLEEFEELVKDPTFRDFICIYLGEGSKRSRNTVAVCNSDPTIVKLANDWILRLGANKVRYSVQYHADQDVRELQQFWGRTLGVKPDQINLQRKSNSNRLTGRTWRSVHGVLTVSMGDTQLRARLQAWMDLIRAEWG